MDTQTRYENYVGFCARLGIAPASFEMWACVCFGNGNGWLFGPARPLNPYMRIRKRPRNTTAKYAHEHW